MKRMVFMSCLLTASMAVVGCSSSDSESTATTVKGIATTSTTLDPATIAKAVPSQVVVSPALVSDIVGAQTPSSPGQQQVAADVTRQEQLLKDLNAQRGPDGIVVPVPEVVLFDFGKAELRPASNASLDKVIELMAFYPRMNVSVEGHTDSVGTDANNQSLSERRATVVADSLRAKGLPAGRLATKGFGESRPVAPNDNNENRQKNRRVEIVILNS